MQRLNTERKTRIAELGYDFAAQPKVGVLSCNLCGSDAFVTLTHRDRYGYPARADACLRCGLVFLNPVMTAEAYGRFYSGVYRPLVSAYHGRLIDAETIQGEQRVYAAELAEFLSPYFAGRDYKTLLDVGGSTGVVAGYLSSRFGLKSVIIDPSPLEVEQARRLGMEAVTGLLEEYDFAGRVFDVIAVCQTVDHLLDIDGALRKAHQLLTSNGLLFIDIVDFRAAYLRNASVEEAVKIDHPFYLTEATLETYLARRGFKVLKKNYAADHLHVGYACCPQPPQSDCLLSSSHVDDLLREVRFVQNAPREARQ